MWKILVFLIALRLTSINAALDPFGRMNDVLSGGAEIGLGVSKKIPDLILTPNDLLNAGKEVILGYPFEVAATAINKLCSVATSADATKPKITPKFEEMKFVLYRNTEKVIYALPDAEKMWSNPAFHKDWPTTLFITGWLTDLKNPTDKAIETMKKAYDARGKNNFIVLDSSGFIDTLYTWSAFNTEAIGIWAGKALAKLLPDYPLEKIHVMGHSLGAHIAGSTGRSFHAASGKLLKRVTGLDPANPCFNEGEGLHGLQRGDAEFVDVIHTNNNVLGKKHPVGDADFYPNGVQSTQPGCIDIMCAHSRAWYFFAETVYNGNDRNMLAVKCNSLRALTTGRCKGQPIPMGFAVPTNIKGNYFLTTRSSKPFGRGLGGTKAN